MNIAYLDFFFQLPTKQNSWVHFWKVNKPIRRVDSRDKKAFKIIQTNCVEYNSNIKAKIHWIDIHSLDWHTAQHWNRTAL